MKVRATMRLTLLALLPLVMAFAGLARAGTIPLEWDPSTDGSVEGYYVYYGSSPGSYPHREYTTSAVYDLSGL